MTAAAEKKPRRLIYTCYPGGLFKCLTLSYDDGRPEDRRLVEIFNEYGLRAAFNINSALHENGRIPLGELAALYKGHEVASHTALHPTIARCPLHQVAEEILDDRRALEAAMGYPVRGLAYPNGSYSQEIIDMLPACGIRYARTVVSTNGFGLPEDFYRWNPTCHHNSPQLSELTDEFLALFKKQYLYLMYVWGHSYEFSRDDNWDVIETFARKIGKQDDIWYATNIEFADYRDAAARLQVAVDGTFVYNPSAATVWISVDGKIVPCPGGKITEI